VGLLTYVCHGRVLKRIKFPESGNFRVKLAYRTSCNVTRIGDTVIVNRAGDVIPQVKKVLKNLRTGKEKEFKMPGACPVDGSKIVKDGVIYRCANPRCGARHRESLYHFVSRRAFDIRGLGAKIIDRFLDEELIGDSADIFTLKEDDIAVLEGFGEKSAQNIIYEIRSHKVVSLPRFLYSLGILHVGEETAALLARSVMENVKRDKEIIKIRDIIQHMSHVSLDNLQAIHDVGPKVAESIYSWFRVPRNVALLKKLDRVGVRTRVEREKRKGKNLSGKTFVLTGTLETMSRDEAKEKIRVFGGAVSENVSKKTDYVVVGDAPGSKYDKARKFGVRIVREKEFLKMI